MPCAIYYAAAGSEPGWLSRALRDLGRHEKGPGKLTWLLWPGFAINLVTDFTAADLICLEINCPVTAEIMIRSFRDHYLGPIIAVGFPEELHELSAVGLIDDEIVSELDLRRALQSAYHPG